MKPGEEDWEAGNRSYLVDNFDKALEAYDRAVLADADNPDYRFNRGVALMRLRQFHKALDDFHSTMEIEPRNPQVRYMLGEVRSEMGERELAILNFQTALGLNPDHAPSKRALRALDPGSTPGDPLKRAHLEIRLTISSPEGEHIGGKPEQEPLRIRTLSEIVHVSSDETPVVAMERTLRSLDRENNLEDTVNKGVVLSALHRREAGPCWKRVLQRGGPNGEALSRAVQSYFESADWEEVCKLSNEAGSRPSEQVLRWNAQAMVAQGRPAEAIELIRTLSDPASKTLRVLAGSYLSLDERGPALAAATQARALDPGNPVMGSLVQIADGSWFAARRPLDSLAGLEATKTIIRERVVLPLLVPELYLSNLATNRFLMMGPPGCGKTTLARVAAAEAHARIEVLHLTSVLNLFTGNSEANLTALFKEAKDLAEEGPVVLLIDEVDSIAVAREAMNQAGERRLVTHFMSELDALRGFPNLVVLAATNVPFDIDSAVLRSGRLGTPLYVAPPDEKAREELIDRQLRGMNHEGIDTTVVAVKLNWYSPADIESAFTTLRFRSRRLRLSGKEHRVTTQEVMDEFDHISPSVRIWFHRLSARLKSEPTLEALLGADLRGDLEKFEAVSKKPIESPESKSLMFR